MPYFANSCLDWYSWRFIRWQEDLTKAAYSGVIRCRCKGSLEPNEGSAQRTAPPVPADSTHHLAWRVLALVNLFRLLVTVLLSVMFVAVTPTRVGQAFPALFVGATAAYFAFGLISIATVKRRWPEVPVQTFTGLCIDVIAIATLTYASGGMTSGLASLMVLPIGALSFVVRQRLALMFAAVATLAVLVQQTLTTLSARGDAGDFASAGIIGALMFIVT